MKNNYYISRNFVEFGAFTAEEIVSFKERHILNEHDYVREGNNQHWMHLAQWLKDHATKSGKATPAKEKTVTKAKKAATRKSVSTSVKPAKKTAQSS